MFFTFPAFRVKSPAASYLFIDNHGLFLNYTSMDPDTVLQFFLVLSDKAFRAFRKNSRAFVF